MQKYIVGLIALLSPIAVVNAQSDNICQSSSISMPATTPSEQFGFVDGNDNVIIDNKTGLMWLRCTYGFEWGADFSCSDSNNSIYTWLEALDEVATQNTTVLYTYSDWRLPNLKELASIIERQCAGLAINKNMFPDTRSSEYWTNTHRLGSTDVRVVNFNGGVVANSVPFDNLLYFRLVRDN